MSGGAAEVQNESTGLSCLSGLPGVPGCPLDKARGQPADGSDGSVRQVAAWPRAVLIKAGVCACVCVRVRVGVFVCVCVRVTKKLIINLSSPSF